LFLLIGIVLLIMIVALLSMVTVPHDSQWMCSVCGAQRRQTVWFGWRRPERVQETALGAWIGRKEKQHEHSWQFVHRRMRSVFGGTLGWACGRAPAIYSLATLGDAMDRYVGSASDEELSALVAVLRTGTDEEQRQAVQRAWDRVLESKP
jgi:hypothetical protein